MSPPSFPLPTQLPLQGRSILIVEDEMIIAMHLEAVLTEVGARVIGPAASSARALALIDRQPPTAAILDVRLGTETSEAVARRLSELGVPFLFYTGQFDLRPLQDLWPAAPVLAKPAAPMEVILAVAELGAPAADAAAAAPAAQRRSASGG